MQQTTTDHARRDELLWLLTGLLLGLALWLATDHLAAAATLGVGLGAALAGAERMRRSRAGRVVARQRA